MRKYMRVNLQPPKLAAIIFEEISSTTVHNISSAHRSSLAPTRPICICSVAGNRCGVGFVQSDSNYWNCGRLSGVWPHVLRNSPV